MASSTSGQPPPSPVVAVVVRGGGRACRRAARWAADNLPSGRFALVHVISPICFVPSPSGERVPVERMGREAAETYARDLRARAQEVLAPFRRLCGRKDVEMVVLEGDSIEEALVRYAKESGVQNLVMGSASFAWFRRLLRLPNVPTTVLKIMPNSCNVFVVSQRRLTMKISNQSQTSKSNIRVRIQSISHKSYMLTQRNSMFDKKLLHDIFPNVEMSKTSGKTSSDSRTQACSSLNATNASQSPTSHGRGNLGSCQKTQGREGNKNFVPPKEASYGTLSMIEESQPIDEVAKLRKALQDTLAMYDKACEDLVHAKKKIDLLSSECSKEAREVEDALRREEVWKQVVTDEKAKHLEAIKAVEEAKEAFTQEAYCRHKAEIVATIMSSEKAKIADALLSTSKSCRRYSRNEIELATDNFSDAKKIGEGGYGNVYRCTLDHTEVAVKVIQQDSSDKTDEFLMEVEILSQLHHPNLVLLLGFCPEIGCLVYEYMENGSLEDQLINNKGYRPLHWFLRFRIIFEVSCGLAFLHSTKPEPIVHRDLKPGNILLGKNYVSKIGDAGLAKLISDLVPDGLTEYKDTVIAGTLYYMDPEYQLTGTVRPKSDVFALGIIILQLLTGKRPNGLIVSAEDAIQKGSFSEILDRSQTDWPIAEAEKLAKLGLRCTALKCRDRPDLELEVLPELDELLNSVTASLKLGRPNVGAPSDFVCPIFQVVMEDPYVAADGHTYEHNAIKAWLNKRETSPVTGHRLPNSFIIPNHSLRAAIQQWKSQSAVIRP